eukprot:19263-Pyramimonas_sp.AAC.1
MGRGVGHELRVQRATAADPPVEAALRVRQGLVDPPAPLELPSLACRRAGRRPVSLRELHQS